MSFAYTTKLMESQALAEEEIIKLLSSGSALTTEEIVANLPGHDPKIVWDVCLTLVEKERLTVKAL